MADEQLPAVRVPAVTDSRQRWQLIRDLVVFQIKLVVDGFKDVVLGPVSLVAGVIDLIRGTPATSGLFHRVLRIGAAFDHWVGLFDAEHPDLAAGPGGPSPAPLPGPEVRVDVPRDPGLDAHLQRLEALIVQQQQRGGLTAEAKKAVDLAIDALEARLKTGTEPPASS